MASKRKSHFNLENDTGIQKKKTKQTQQPDELR